MPDAPVFASVDDRPIDDLAREVINCPALRREVIWLALFAYREEVAEAAKDIDARLQALVCGGYFAKFQTRQREISRREGTLPDYVPTHRCYKCKELRPLTEFLRRPNGDIRPPCKSCKSQEQRDWRAANPDKYAASLERDNERRQKKRQRQETHPALD